jgi:hypothetical protein
MRKKKFLPAQEGETFSSGCLETVGIGGHLQALLQAVQGLPDRHQCLGSAKLRSSVADPGSGAFSTPESGTNIPDHFPRAFRAKNS